MSRKTPQIESYEFGRITIDGRSFNQDLIITPRGIQQSWWRKDGHRLLPEDIEGVEELGVEVLVVGTGANGRMKITQEAVKWLVDSGIELFALPTPLAVERYRELAGSGKVAAALHLTC